MVISTERSESSARSETTRRRSKSMLAPEVMATKVAPETPHSSTCFFKPAMASAPAGSRTTRLPGGGDEGNNVACHAGRAGATPYSTPKHQERKSEQLSAHERGQKLTHHCTPA